MTEFETWWNSQIKSYRMEYLKPRFQAAYAAGLAARVPEGWKMVEVSLLQRAADSLGSFCSDHGWSDADMDVLDSVIAQLPAAPEPTK